jgi:Zn finger protein HypA/HybF involved in hydrogenase expression
MAGYPLTEAFLRVIEETARSRKGKRITKIRLRLGKGVVLPPNTSAYLECLLKGTAAKGADIYIRRGNYAGRCRCCGLVFANDKHIACPACGSESNSIVLNGKFIIDAIEMEA